MISADIEKKQKKFIENILKCSLWEKQLEIADSVRNNYKTSARSCHGSGKTFSAARIALWFLFAHLNSVVVTTAPTFRQVEQLLWREIRAAHKFASIPLGGDMLKTRFEINEDWFAIGVSSKTPEGVAGFHAENILVIGDESSGISREIFEAIEGMLTSDGARLLMLGNPTTNDGYFAESFTDPDVKKIHISAFDTPNFTLNAIRSVADLTDENVERARVYFPGLVTPRWALSMLKKYGSDSDVWRVRVMGEFPKGEADVLISVDRVAKAIGAERELYGSEEIYGVDPARYGDDWTSIIYRKGNFARVVMMFQGQDTMRTAGETTRLLRENKKAMAHIDSIGVGAGVLDRCKEHSDIKDRVFGLNSASSPEDKEHYVNLRAEGWDDTNEWLKDAVLEENENWYELSKPKYKIKSNGKMQIESKEEMKKRGIPSPNTADALVLTIMRRTEESEPRIRIL